MIYFTSDTHYGHRNIAGENVSKWKEGYRKYGSTEAMNEAIVKSFNKTLQPDDLLYHLGDWSFGGEENIDGFMRQLRCQNVHLILGNHDEHIEKNKFTSTNIPVPGTNNTIMSAVNAQDVFTSVSHYLEVKIQDTTFVLFHYPIASWHHAGKGNIHLYGHCHDTFENRGKSMDVGVDAAIRLFGEPRPFSYTEIMEIMNKKKNHTRNE